MLHDVLLGVALALFGSAGATAIGVIAATVAPQWSRICRLALGHVEPSFTPLTRAQPMIRVNENAASARRLRPVLWTVAPALAWLPVVAWLNQ
ncbi:hypothetical protein [Sphingomonas sp. Leaf230]|uniref:hypothetical protein n=1 Tax=Sphingomonas sp. Leaf230 TaxID=1735694 RepID=UPI000AFE9239|nr:hypothetical protein [Sphingomonas sp. Leaf230]